MKNSLLEELATMAKLDPHVGLRSCQGEINDTILSGLIRGRSSEAIISQMGPVKVLNGYRDHTVGETDVKEVAGFLRRVREVLNALDIEARQLDSRSEAIRRLLATAR